MLDASAGVLIVDDESLIRTSLSLILTEVGYHVRSAESGFSALFEIQRDLPDILVSDLNMPGLSGFELLSVVRRQFPSIRTVAMSGAFSGNEVPSGVAADAFYQKGCGVASLLKILAALPLPDRVRPNQPAPMEIRRSQPEERDSFETLHVTIACPKCRGAFPHALTSATFRAREVECVHCRSLIPFAIVDLTSGPRATGLGKNFTQ